MSAKDDIKFHIRKSMPACTTADWGIVESLAGLIAIEAFTTDDDSRGSAQRTLDHIEVTDPGRYGKGIRAGREAAGQMMSRTAMRW